MIHELFGLDGFFFIVFWGLFVFVFVLFCIVTKN